jgi:cell division protein FtsB
LRPRLLVGALLLCGAAYFAVFGGDYDLFDLQHVRQQRAQEDRRVEDVRAEVERLRARRDSLLHDSATIERIARERYGLIRNGERLYRFAAPPEDSAGVVPAPDGS